MRILRDLLELCNRFAQKWGRRHCYACGVRVKRGGYDLLGRRYCSTLCAPAVYRQWLAGNQR
jgi:hypothetical protein